MIYHAIALAAAAVEAGNKNKREGSGLLGNDYKAAFDLMVASWPIMVLQDNGQPAYRQPLQNRGAYATISRRDNPIDSEYVLEGSIKKKKEGVNHHALHV